MPRPDDPDSLASKLANVLAALEQAPSGVAAALGPLRDLVSVAEQREREWALEQRHHERRVRLEAVLPKLAESLDVAEVFSELSQLIRDVIPHEVLAFALLLEDRSGVRIRAATAQGVRELPPYRFSNAEEALDSNWQFLLAYDLEPVDAESVRARISPPTEAEPRLVITRPGEQWMRFITQHGIRSTMRVPIRLQDRPIGGVAFMSRSSDAFDREDAQVATRVADHLALAVAHQKLAENQRMRDRLAALDARLPQIVVLRDLDEIASVVDRVARGILTFDAVGVMVKHTGGGFVSGILDGERRVPAELTTEFLEHQFEQLGEVGSMRIMDLTILDESRRRVKQTIAIGDELITRELEVSESTIQGTKTMGSRSEMWIGIRQGEEYLGVLIFVSRTPNHFTETDLRVAERIAERISLRLAQEQVEGAGRQAREAAARAKQLEGRVEVLQRELERFSAHRAIGQSASWKHALAVATQVSATDTTVLITGESGTGKEVIARYIHRGSKRVKGPFVALNCAALPEQLLESELFGHERGAFTGATDSRPGKIEQAHGGVLFLDEVGEMSPAVQAKFLRVLQEREFQRVGGSKVIHADVRIVAATNRDPRAAIAAGQFREDLYYRLGVFEIHLPPLRERPEDILVLAQAFLAEIGESIGLPAAGISEDAREHLLAHTWPGNVRELRNAIERAVILCHGGLVSREHLPFAISRATPADRATTVAAGAIPSDDGLPLAVVERRMLEQALEKAGRNKSQAAKLLGLTRGQLYSLLRRHKLTDARR